MLANTRGFSLETIRKITKYATIACCAMLLFFSNVNIASATIVKSIDISGLERVEKVTIMPIIDVKTGENITQKNINEIIKKLYTTKQFATVNAEISSTGVLMIEVVENPVINDVIIAGIPEGMGDAIKEQIDLQVRGVYTKEKMKQDTEKIVGVFQKSGKLNAKIIPKIELLPRNRVNVMFEIIEGLPSRVEHIVVTGNEDVNSSEVLTNVKNTARYSYLDFIEGNVFEEDSLELDKTAIKEAYMQVGYADAKVNHALAEYDRDAQNFTLNFDLTEGEKYRFGLISVVSDVPNISPSIIDPDTVDIKTGDIYNYKKVEAVVASMTASIADKGYALTQIETELMRDEDANIINVKFIIKATYVVYIGRINILGTTRTHDYVVRQELLMAEGDLYNKTKIERSKLRLRMLGYFDAVDVQEKQTDQADVIDLDVIVIDRKQTGNVSFSVGYSTYEALIVSVGLTKSNLFGMGYNGSISATISAWRRTLSMGITNPHFMGTNLSLGFDFSYTNVYAIQSLMGANTYIPPYSQNAITLAMRLGYKITDHLSNMWSFQYRASEMQYESGDTVESVLYKAAVTGNQVATMVTSTMSYDKRDNPVLPVRGFLLSITESVSLPLPNQYHFESTDLMGSLYIPLESSGEWVLTFVGRAGAIIGYGNDGIYSEVPFQNRYSVGYYNMRGFYISGIGPRAEMTPYTPTSPGATTYKEGQSTYMYTGFRGNYYYVGTMELRMPSPFPKDYGVHFLAFADVGGLFGFDGPTNTSYTVPPPTASTESGINDYQTYPAGTVVQETVVGQNAATPRVAIGGGVLWMSPMGPIRFEAAYALVKEVYDVPLAVRITFNASPI